MFRAVVALPVAPCRLRASLSSAERSMERRSRCAAMNVRRSSPWTVGGIRVPEFERSRFAWEGIADGLEDVAALTAEAKRE